MSQQDRDAAVDRLLRRSTAGPSPARGEACLDADVLAAWADDALSAAAREAVELHAADCARCQSLLSAMVRTEPPAAAVRSSGWFRPGHLRWAVPLVAAVLVTAVYVVVAPDQKVPMAESDQVLSLPEPAAPRAGGDERAEPAPLAKREPPAEVKDEPPASPAERRRVAAVPDGTALKYTDKLASPESSRAQAAAGQEQASQKARADAAPAAPPPPAAAPAPPPAAQGAFAQTQPVPRQMEGQTAQLQDRTALGRQVRAEMPAVVTVGEGAVRWRILGGTTVQHSTDGGATWQTQDTGAHATITSGSSPAPAVCWLVGRAGTVLLTIDGTAWRRVTFPESVDLVQVQAVDARTATVTTSDGRRFSTADAGGKWEMARAKW